MTVELVGWALIHSLWEGAIVAAGLALALTLTRRAGPSLRYLLSLIALALTVVLPLATAVATRPGDVPSDVAAGAVAPMPPAGPERSPVTTPAREARSSGYVAAPGLVHPAVARAVHWIEAWIDVLLPWLVAGWVAGLLLFSTRLVGGLVRLRRLARAGTTIAAEEVRAIGARVAGRLRLHAAVRILESTRVYVPIAMGWIRPVILLPAALVTGLTPQQLEMLIAHELAHIRRHDALVNLLQTVVDTLLFYQPAVWWISEQIREEREQCCDDLAVTVCRGDVAAYTSALLALAEWRGEGIALANAATGGPLLRRVVRLVSAEPARIELGPRWVAGVVTAVTVVAAVVVMGGAVGQSAPLTARPAANQPRVAEAMSAAGGDSRPILLPDTSLTTPLPITHVAATSSLAQRWAVAAQRARERGATAYWVGYVTRGNDTAHRTHGIEDTHRRHHDGRRSTARHVPAVRLASLIAASAPGDMAIVLGFERRHGDTPELTRFRLGGPTGTLHADGWPVYWLGRGSNAESIHQLQDLVGRATSEDLRTDLVAAVGLHSDARATVPVLAAWMLDGFTDDDVRDEAAEWLGRSPTRGALTALASTARFAEDEDVRGDAIEALGAMALPTAADSLVAVMHVLHDHSLRMEVVRALGHRAEPWVADSLLAFARGDGRRPFRLEAIESLEDLPNGLGIPALAILAQRDPWDDIRRKAVEQLGHAGQVPVVFATLSHVVQHDPDDDVRDEALESLTDIESPETVATLAGIVRTSSNHHVQRTMVAALGHAHPRGAAIDALADIAWHHPDADVRRAAVTALGWREEHRRAREVLAELSESAADRHLRTLAAEQLRQRD